MEWFSRKPKPDPTPMTDGDKLLVAIAMGDPAIVRSAVVDHKVDPNAPSKHGTPALVFAAGKGDEAIVNLLLEAGADPKAADPGGGMTALHASAVQGWPETARKLVDRGADPNATLTDPPVTPLAIAYRRGHSDVARVLLEAGARPDVEISEPDAEVGQAGVRPIHHAAATGDAAMALLLLQKRADPNAPKGDGLTPLMLAAMGGHLEVVKLLRRARANPNLIHAGDPRQPFTALDIAEQMGHAAVAEYLRGKGAISIRDPAGL